MKNKAYYIRKKFPDKCNILDFLLSVDPDFLSLCEDYDACIKALHYWCSSTAPEAELRVNEYKRLILELQDEIEHILSIWSCQ